MIMLSPAYSCEKESYPDNRRIHSNRVFENIAKTGKGSTG
jgi:hypothetical protein